MQKVLNEKMTSNYIKMYLETLEKRIEFKKGMKMQNKNDGSVLDFSSNDDPATLIHT